MAAIVPASSLKSIRIQLNDDDTSRLGHDTPALNLRCWRGVDNKAAPQPTVLFLPFWGGSAATYDSLIGILASIRPNGTYIAVSYRGTGTGRSAADGDDSDEPRVGTEGQSITEMAHNILAFLQSKTFNELCVSREIVICAHSMSAKVALELLNLLSLAADWRATNLTVTALLLLAPAPPGPLVLPQHLREQSLQAYSTLESARWTVENVLTHKKLEDSVVEQLARDAVAMGPEMKKRWPEVNMAWDCRDAARSAVEKCPRLKVSVVVGKNDQVETPGRVMDETVQVLRDLGLDCKIEIVPDCGHLVPVEQPELVARKLIKLLSAE